MNRYLQQFSVLSVLVSALGLISAAPAVAQLTVWELGHGDRFSIETTIEHETTLKTGDAEPVVSRRTERTVLHYSVTAAHPNGTTIDVRIGSVQSRSGTESDETQELRDRMVQRLRSVLLKVRLNANGTPDEISGYDEMMQVLAGSDERSFRLMKQVFPRETLTALITQPFWLTPSQDLREYEDASWERISESSLGLLGSVRCVITCKVSEAKDNSLKIALTANSRHVAVPPVRRPSADKLSCSDVSVKSEQFIGEGQIIFRDQSETETDDEPVFRFSRRPWFEKLSLQTSLSGTATLTVGKTSRPMEFQRKQKTELKLLPGYVMRFRPEPADFPPPPPR